MSDYTPIPDDLWPQILLNSPPEALIRCRCVCKSWRSLISSPSFISSHLSSQSQQPLLLARESPSLQQNPHKSYILFRPQSLPSFDFRFRSDPHPNLRIVGTANGVICLADEFLGWTDTIVLWNPLIRRFVQPPTPIYSSPAVRYTITLGFGFDPSNNDLKIVRIARAERGSVFGRRVRSPPNAEVFSVREGKWRAIDYIDQQCTPFENRWAQCLLNGAAHWAGNLRSTRHVLLSFRFETEEFKMIELPEELQRAQVSVSKVGSLLSVLRYGHALSTCAAGAHTCDVWVMHVYSEASSWCKMVRLSWEGGGLRDVMWVREDFGEVIVSTVDDEVFTYDPWNRDVRSIGFRCKGDGCFADGFVGSLELLDQYTTNPIDPVEIEEKLYNQTS